MNEYVLIWIVSFVAAILGSEFGHRIKGVKRGVYAKAAVHLVSGFGASVLTLIVLAQFVWYPLLVSVVIGLWYGFFMANAEAYSSIV